MHFSSASFALARSFDSPPGLREPRPVVAEADLGSEEGFDEGFSTAYFLLNIDCLTGLPTKLVFSLVYIDTTHFLHSK